MPGITKAVCVIIGTIIGAGFASGKEIYLFFNTYGEKGILGIITASIVTGIIIYKVLMQIGSLEVNNYKEYLSQMKINSKIKEILNIIINIFLLMSFYIMIAGFCAYFKQEFNIPTIVVGTIVSLACYITFMNNIEGVTKINTILIPFLILMIVLLGIKVGGTNFTEVTTEIGIKTNWLLSSLEYASYNSILLIPMLIGLKEYTHKKEKNVAIIASGIFCVLAIILYKILQTGGAEIQNVELPLIYIVNKFGNVYKYIYGIVIVSAIYTSAIAGGYGFVQNCSKTKETYKKLCVFLCITAIPVSKLGFSYLVTLLYPVFGMLGLIQVIYIVFTRKRLEKNSKN